MFIGQIGEPIRVFFEEEILQHGIKVAAGGTRQRLVRILGT
jgi:hypothetical protein